MSKHILFVEDELAQQDMFETAVTDWNRSNEEKQFSFALAKNVEEAGEALDRVRCDAALFDLRVNSRDGGKAEATGNELALKALRSLGIPVAIISANTVEIDPTVRSAGAVQIFDKNDPQEGDANYYDRALSWLASEWDMMEVMSAARKEIDGAAAGIFLRRLWPRWKVFSQIEANRKGLVQIVTRQYAGHIADMLGLDDASNEGWHPFENYISPSLLSDRAHTGDIFRFNDGLRIVLSPQCDMATRKIRNVIVAKCEVGIQDWGQKVATMRDKDAPASAIDKSTAYLRKFVNQNLETSRHFLPPLPGEEEPLIVHFSDIETVPLEELNGSLEKREAAIASPFLSNLVQRYGAYISRTGQPNIDVTKF